MKLTKYSDRPILSPDPNLPWGSLVATNPGAWYDEDRHEVLMVYRAAGDDPEHRVNLALARSSDGFYFERIGTDPILLPSKEGGWDGGCVEDPRIVKFGEWYFITYAARAAPPGQYWIKNNRHRTADFPDEAPRALKQNTTRTGLLLTKDFRTVYRAGCLTDATQDDRDVILFPEKIKGKFVTLHRPMEMCGDGFENNAPAMWIAYSDDLLEPKKLELLAQSRPGCSWEAGKIGGGAPPIKTDKGWLHLYHGVGADARYYAGAMLLDLEDPRMVLHRTPDPVLVPEFDFECKGIYKGICFPCGNVVIDGKLIVYYGGADQYVGAAYCALNELLDHLLTCPGNPVPNPV